MKAQMNMLQHVGSHVAVQKHERVGRRLRNCKTHLVFRRQDRVIRVEVIFNHCVSLAKGLSHCRVDVRFDVLVRPTDVSSDRSTNRP